MSTAKQLESASVKAGHTPGPWRYLPDGPSCLRTEIRKPNYRTIEAGHGFFGDGGHGFELTGYLSEADAMLVAAAPELLAALEAVAPEGWLDDATMDHMPGIKQARAALAKAKGTPMPPIRKRAARAIGHETFLNLVTIELAGHEGCATSLECECEVEFFQSPEGGYEVSSIQPFRRLIDPTTGRKGTTRELLDCPGWLEELLADCIDTECLNARS
jgi:hypothetical protein